MPALTQSALAIPWWYLGIGILWFPFYARHLLKIGGIPNNGPALLTFAAGSLASAFVWPFSIISFWALEHMMLKGKAITIGEGIADVQNTIEVDAETVANIQFKAHTEILLVEIRRLRAIIKTESRTPVFVQNHICTEAVMHCIHWVQGTEPCCYCEQEPSNSDIDKEFTD